MSWGGCNVVMESQFLLPKGARGALPLVRRRTALEARHPDCTALASTSTLINHFTVLKTVGT